jgi:energy-coupling factor transporter ATP-binding protein EcfA2
MSFQPSKVISLEQIAHIMYRTLGYQTTNQGREKNDITSHDLAPNSEESYIEIGSLDPLFAPDAFMAIMDKWVAQMEKYLDLLKGDNTPQYQALYQQLRFERGFTFAEYCHLFDAHIAESDYLRYPVFAVLGIHTNALRRHFIHQRETNVNDYIETLSKIRMSGWDFFLQKLGAIIPYGELLKHCYITGKSGSGKSELMKTMLYNIQKKSQRKRSASIVLLDPHGDLAEDVRAFHLNKDRERLLYVFPYLRAGKMPVINPLQLPTTASGTVMNDEDTINLISEELVKVFQELLHNTSLTNQMQALLMPCIASLLRKGDASLIDLQTFMDDDNNSHLVELGMQSPNPSHRYFFSKQFYNSSYKLTKSSIFTKIQSLLNSHTFYNLVTGKSTINIEQAMNQGKVIVFNLSKGRMGVEASEAFGRFVIATIQTIAQRRAKLPEHKRKPSFVFIDEFQNYITDSIQIILKEARKFKVPLILANQTAEDIRSTEMLSNILNNTEVKLVGRNGIKTLRELSREIGVSIDDLQKMKRYHFYVKTGDRTAHQFKTTAFLKSKAYQLSKEEIEQLDDYQVQHYYTTIKQENPNDDFTLKMRDESQEEDDLASGFLEKLKQQKEWNRRDKSQFPIRPLDRQRTNDTSHDNNIQGSPKPKFDL